MHVLKNHPAQQANALGFVGGMRQGESCTGAWESRWRDIGPWLEQGDYTLHRMRSCRVIYTLYEVPAKLSTPEFPRFVCVVRRGGTESASDFGPVPTGVLLNHKIGESRYFDISYDDESRRINHRSAKSARSGAEKCHFLNARGGPEDFMGLS